MATQTSTPATHPYPPENRLLAALPQQVRDHLGPMLQTIQLQRAQALLLQGEPLEMVYFPITAVLSLVNILKNGSSTEISTVGSEGMVGLPAFLGGMSEPYGIVVQISGSACRMLASALDAETGKSGPLRDLLLRYTQVFVDNMAQEVACGRHHTLKQRFATWILTQGDRVGGLRIQVTHEYAAEMLSVGRSSVSLMAAELQRGGLLGLSRGSMTILDRPGLEEAACECYSDMRDEYDHLYQ